MKNTKKISHIVTTTKKGYTTTEGTFVPFSEGKLKITTTHYEDGSTKTKQHQTTKKLKQHKAKNALPFTVVRFFILLGLLHFLSILHFYQ